MCLDALRFFVYGSILASSLGPEGRGVWRLRGRPGDDRDSFFHFQRDGSACASMQRAPKPGGRPGELQDYWLKYHHVTDVEKEFPLRNKQVS